jgi:hypothetical protein
MLITDGPTRAPTHNTDPMWPQRMQIMHLLRQPKPLLKKALTAPDKMPHLPDAHLIPRPKPDPNGAHLQLHQQQSPALKITLIINPASLLNHVNLKAANALRNPRKGKALSKPNRPIFQKS